MIAMGLVAFAMFALRFFAFTLYESPKYLMGKGRDSQAVEVVHKIAARNKKTSSLTVDRLTAYNDGLGASQGTDARAALRRRLEKVNFDHIRSLFATRKLAFSTSIITVVWAFIGLGFPLYNSFLPYIQDQKGAEFGDGSTYLTYRNSLIIAVLGIPGAIVGGILVEIPKFGRKGALSVATALTGVFLFGSTTALTSNALLGWNCAYNFMSNIMYAVLYAYTPEVSPAFSTCEFRQRTLRPMSFMHQLIRMTVLMPILQIFPTKDRGTGNAITATANRIFGIMAPIVAIYANLNTPVPVYVSGALFIVAGLLVMLLPFEPKGRASL